MANTYGVFTICPAQCQATYMLYQYFILPTTPQGKVYKHLHFTGEETLAWKGKITSQGHIPSHVLLQESGKWNPELLILTITCQANQPTTSARVEIENTI